MSLHFLAAALLLGPAGSAAATATLVSLQGGVFVTPPNASEKTATAGSKLDPGTRVRTDNTGTAELAYDDGSVLRLRPDSSMQLSKQERTRAKSSVILFFGQLWHKVSGQRDGSYEVSTPNAVCGVRGTTFETAVGDDSALHMSVSEGAVEVSRESSRVDVPAGKSVEADDGGVSATTISSSVDWAHWRSERQERLRQRSAKIVDALESRVQAHRARCEAVRTRQREVMKQRKATEKRLRNGEKAAADDLRHHQQELATLADELADLSDAAESSVGAVDHFADLANDPRFASLNRKHLVAEAKALRKIKASLDALVKEGTDISQASMDKLLEEFGDGARGTLRDKKGSTRDELFDNE